MICSFEYRFDEDERFAWTVFQKPSDRGFLTRSDGGPRRAGRWRVLDRASDFSPHLPCPPILRRLGFVLCCKEPAQDRREGVYLKTADKRYPLDHPRKPHRSPYVRPPHAFR
uniref:Uncharacterized protein n=1 Tax=Caulobacter sp. (strain K31) TaxID=366602 RepID=B0T144_CAUSK